MHLKRALRVKKAQLTYCDISNEDVQGPNILPNYQIIYIYIYPNFNNDGDPIPPRKKERFLVPAIN